MSNERDQVTGTRRPVARYGGRTDGRTSGTEHEAFLYRGLAEFVQSTTAFILGGLARRERVCVAVRPEKIRLLRARLGTAASRVTFLDMADVGRNPARIVPVWGRLAEETAQAGQRLRGVAEPLWPGRTAAEIAEVHLNEALTGGGAATGSRVLMRCPYDVAGLDPAVLRPALRTHPLLCESGRRWANPGYDEGEAATLFATPLPEPPTVSSQLAVEADGDLPRVHGVVMAEAAAAWMPAGQAGDLALAVYEVTTNGLRHGGGSVRLRTWRESDRLVCEVTDAGRMTDPSLGRRRPPSPATPGRGLWLVNQLCDLVQVRSGPGGTAVRMSMEVPGLLPNG